LLYMMYKLARKDLHAFYQIDGSLGAFVNFGEKVCVKIITDYTGCLVSTSAIRK